MGTSTMSSDQHSERQDKLAKLEARKKELEQLLAVKNEELYKLCVQEVQLTGIMPPEAPMSPDTSAQTRERLGSIKSAGEKTLSEGEDVRDSNDNLRTSRRFQRPHADRSQESERQNAAYRLSTPSISGGSAKSGQSRHSRRAETSCSSYYPNRDRSPETYSLHASHAYPSAPTTKIDGPLNAADTSYRYQSSPDHHGIIYRQHTINTEQISKVYYNTLQPEARSTARMKETHFSSSHPDIATQYTHAGLNAQPPPSSGLRSTPLLYQYASHLKAQSQHLSGMHQHQHHITQTKRRSESGRRNTLQRTQTYHLTSHSDYSTHLETMNNNLQQINNSPTNRSYANMQAPDNRDSYFSSQNSVVGSPEQTYPISMQVIKRNQWTVSPQSHMQLPLTDDCNNYFNYQQMSPSVVSTPSLAGIHQFADNASIRHYPVISGGDNSDTKSIKEKQWYETSLDAPSSSNPRSVTPKLSSSSLKRSPSLSSSQHYEVMISPASHNPPILISPTGSLQSSQPMLSPGSRDVPLESPKNCTVIEQGKWIPYREVTKPFEMSDFYKYSTKFRQATQKPSSSPSFNTAHH